MISLRNGRLTASFTPSGRGYRPDWFREGSRNMVRFKDHEFLNVGHVRVTEGELKERSDTALTFAGRVTFGGALVGWSVRIAIPDDGHSGFTITTRLIPVDEPIELLEAMSTFELPYDYDGTEHATTVMAQQPVYRRLGDEEINGAGYSHPLWYYGRAGITHLTYPSSSPLLATRVQHPDGSNSRCVMLLGNWDKCSFHDIFTHTLPKDTTPRGVKFLMGALNWNTSLHKDPNVVVEPKSGLTQELTLDFATDMPQARWDTWLASGWERLVRIHQPRDGRIAAHDVATSRGASWTNAATWLAEQFGKHEGCPGFFHPVNGPHVYSPGTRPKWDNGVPIFAGQWVGPLAYLGHVWGDERIVRASERCEEIFTSDKGHPPEHIWTIGPTPMYCAVMRKARLRGIQPTTLAKVRDYVTQRTEIMLNPPPGTKRGDGGILAWDAFANLLAADLFDRDRCESAARQLLERVNAKLDGEFWSFNCAAEGDLVGAGNARPFGHAIASAANVLAWQRFKDPRYLDAAERFGNLTLAMHFITYNESQSPDLDTRGWAHGSTGGRDQMAQLPPWETGFAIQQFSPLILAGKARDGFYDVLWYFARTGLAQFPVARTMKRLYRPGDMSITYRAIDEIASEREFYLKLPYVAYENPWDQTMLAAYQGVEPIILSLMLGGGIVRAEDDRILALVPEAAVYASGITKSFTAHLWNPTRDAITTRLTCNPKFAACDEAKVPSWQVIQVRFNKT